MQHSKKLRDEIDSAIFDTIIKHKGIHDSACRKEIIDKVLLAVDSHKDVSYKDINE